MKEKEREALSADCKYWGKAESESCVLIRISMHQEWKYIVIHYIKILDRYIILSCLKVLQVEAAVSVSFVLIPLQLFCENWIWQITQIGLFFALFLENIKVFYTSVAGDEFHVSVPFIKRFSLKIEKWSPSKENAKWKGVTTVFKLCHGCSSACFIIKGHLLNKSQVWQWTFIDKNDHMLPVPTRPR